MDDAERRALAAIARGPELHMKKATLDELHLPRSTARDARDRLAENGYVHGKGRSLEIVDPLLALWIASGRESLGVG